MTESTPNEAQVPTSELSTRVPVAQEVGSSLSNWLRLSWTNILFATVIIVAGLCAYWPALGGGWLWTDDVLISDNPDLHSLSGLWRIWFTAPETDYWPLTWTLLWVEWHLWGNQTLGYHLSTLTFHVISGFLIWNLFSRLGLRWGWLAALIFIVHPLNVDSVAWNSEIKNTFSLPLLLLSVGAFMDAEQHASAGAYIRSVLFYLAAMLAKTSVIMLPVVLLAYCWWKRGEITLNDLRKLLPYLAIALLLGVVTLYFQTTHMADVVPGEPTPTEPNLQERVLIAGTAIYFYIGKFLFPFGLAPLYPHWSDQVITPCYFLCLPLLGLAFSLLFLVRTVFTRHTLFGLSFFVINLIPVLGIVPMVYENVSWVGNHLVYLPMIGLIGLSVAGCEALNDYLGKAGGIVLKITIAIVCVVFTFNSYAYSELFQSKETLYAYTVKHNPYNYDVRNNLGICLAQRGQIRKAGAEFEAAVWLNPKFADALQNLGGIYFLEGRFSDAVEQLQKAIQMDPKSAVAHNTLGLAFAALPGRTSDAIAEYQTAINLDPNYAEPHENLGLVLAKTPGGAQQAIAQYREALKINPNFLVARYNLDKTILSVDPNNAIAHNNLGTAYLQMPGRLADAIAEYREAIRIAPNFAGAQFGLANALLRQPDGVPEAIAHLKLAVQLDPNLEPATKLLNRLRSLYPGL